MTEDAVADRLDQLEAKIRDEFEGVVTVKKEPASWAGWLLRTEVEPTTPGRCPAWWGVDEDEIQCGIGQHASFERRRDLETVDFISWLVDAAAGGRVVEVTGMNDVVLRARTPDGQKLRHLAIGAGEFFRLPWHRNVRYWPWCA